jgi:hypothetical protein
LGNLLSVLGITDLLPPNNIGTSSEGNNFIIKQIGHYTISELVPLAECPVMGGIPEPMGMAEALKMLTMIFRNQHILIFLLLKALNLAVVALSGVQTLAFFGLSLHAFSRAVLELRGFYHPAAYGANAFPCLFNWGCIGVILPRFVLTITQAKRLGILHIDLKIIFH